MHVCFIYQNEDKVIIKTGSAPIFRKSEIRLVYEIYLIPGPYYKETVQKIKNPEPIVYFFSFKLRFETQVNSVA